MPDAERKTSAPKRLISTNPAQRYEILGEVAISPITEIKAKVRAARAAQKAWAAMHLSERIQVVRAFTHHLSQHKDAFITHQSVEMGMPRKLSQSVFEGFLAEMVWNCDHAENALSPEILQEDAQSITELVREPYGVVACIVAWNFPFGNFVVSASQALLAGNTVVMKYSEEVPLFSKYLEEVVASSDLPKDVIHFVYGDREVGAYLADQQIDCLTFTGSSDTGRTLYQKAASKLIPISLELGGSSPGIVFEDCALDDALVERLFWKRFLNSGQFCDNMKRLIVHHNLLEKVVQELKSCAQTKSLGDPMSPDTDLGPLVAERQLIKLEHQVKDALDKGARLHCGGQRPKDLKGAFYEPTLLTGITKDMLVWREEVFGPVLPIIGFETYDEALSLANDTPYGLSGSVFTNNPHTAQKAQRDLKAGSLDHNQISYFSPQNPFGGYKASGIGRQKGQAGFDAVTQTKVMAREKAASV